MSEKVTQNPRREMSWSAREREQCAEIAPTEFAPAEFAPAEFAPAEFAPAKFFKRKRNKSMCEQRCVESAKGKRESQNGD